jgi:hypothetical protein
MVTTSVEAEMESAEGVSALENESTVAWVNFGTAVVATKSLYKYIK